MAFQLQKYDALVLVDIKRDLNFRRVKATISIYSQGPPDADAFNAICRVLH